MPPPSPPHMNEEMKPSPPPRATDLPRPQPRQPPAPTSDAKKTLGEKMQQRWEGERCKNLDLSMKHSNTMLQHTSYGY
jgi:hypothetical protein